MNDDQARCVAHEVARSTRAGRCTRDGTQSTPCCACGVFDNYETQLRTVSSVCRGSVACHVGGRRCRIPWIEDLFVHMCVLRVTVRVVRVETDVLVESAAYSIKKLTRYSLGLGATICRWLTTFFVCAPVATNVRWPPSPSVKMRQEVNSIDFPACSTVLSTSSVLPSGAADTQVTCRSMVTDILKSSISNAAVAARHSGHTRLGTGAVGMEGIYELAWRTEGVNECARSPAVKIGGAVGNASGDGQCNHKPPRLATYHLAVTEHNIGELPEVAFRSCVSSEDGLHRGRREWRHTTTNQLRPYVPGLCDH